MQPIVPPFKGKGAKATVPLELDSRGDESGCGDCAALSAFPICGGGGVGRSNYTVSLAQGYLGEIQ